MIITTQPPVRHNNLRRILKNMKRIITAGLLIVGSLVMTVSAQDWYHEREERFRAEEWRHHIFEHVRGDLDHIGSAIWASGKEQTRLRRTRQELSELQAKLDHGRYDERELNDVIDSIRKSANDNRLAQRDRDVLNDDFNRLSDYREHHEHWYR